jgi:hypothetical protein
MKSGSLNFLEPSGPVQVCNGTALPLPFYIKNYPDIHKRRVNWRVKSNLNTNDLNLFIRQPYLMNINCTNFKRKFTNRVFCNLLDTSTNCSISYQAIWSTFINQTIITNKETTIISPYSDQEGNKLMFLSEWREFPSAP